MKNPLLRKQANPAAIAVNNAGGSGGFPSESDAEPTENSLLRHPDYLTASADKMEFQEEMRGAHHGQSDMTLRAVVNGKVVGYIEYSVYENTPAVQWIEVFDKRHGYGTALLQKLQTLYPDAEIDLGMTTEDGTHLVNSLKFDERPTVYAEKFRELESLRKEFGQLQSQADAYHAQAQHSEAEKNLFREQFPRWNTLSDRIWELEQELWRQQPSQRRIVSHTMLLEPEVEAIAKKYEAQGLEISLTGSKVMPDFVTLHAIHVPKAQRGEGLGTAFMEELSAWADRAGKTLVLTPTTDFGATSVNRLRRFYGRFGFVRNKGRNKDFRSAEAMIRRPARRTASVIEVETPQHKMFVASVSWSAGEVSHLRLTADSAAAAAFPKFTAQEIVRQIPQLHPHYRPKLG